MTLIVCPAARLAEICRERSPFGVIRFVAPGAPETDPVPNAENLVLRFNDVAAPRPGLVAPDRAAIEALLAFGRGWDATRPLVVSCEAGVSRSTAAAFCLACQGRPDRPEGDIAAALRQACPTATPNPLMVALADRALGRRGRMEAAVASIGRGADYVPYRSVDFALLRDDGAAPAVARASPACFEAPLPSVPRSDPG